MAIFYVSPSTGNDANNGTTWALARKTLTATGWQSFPGLTGSDTIYVERSRPADSAGLLTFTNASKTVNFHSISASFLFSKDGDYFNQPATAIRNTTLYSANVSDFQIQGSPGTYTIGARARYHEGTGAYSWVGTVDISATVNPTVTSADYIAVRVTGRSTTASMAVSFNASNPSSGSVNDSVGTQVISVTYNLNESFNKSASVGGVLYSANATEKMGSTDTLFFKVPASISTISNVSFFTLDSSTTSSFVIESISIVRNIPTYLPTATPNVAGQMGRTVNKGLNMVIGTADERYTKMQLTGFDLINSAGVPKFVGYMSFNWGQATMSLVPGVTEVAYQINYDAFLSVGASGGLFLTVQGGVNPATNLVEGVTRLCNGFQTATGTSPGINNFELYCRNGAFSGFAMHNFAQGLRLKLNSSRINQNYTFDDIQGNNYGYYLYSDDATCPSKVFVHYKNFGPNNLLLTDSTLAACPGWSANLTKGTSVPVSSSASWTLARVGGGVDLGWDTNATSSVTMSPSYGKLRAWSTNVTSTVAEALKRNRGMAYTSTTTATTTEALRRTTKQSFTVENVSSTSEMIGQNLRLRFSANGVSGSTFTNEVAKGFKWNSSVTSTSVLNLKTILPVTWSSAAVGAVSLTYTRNRGYKWSAPVTALVVENLRAGRAAAYGSTTTSAVQEKLLRSFKRGFSSTETSSVAQTDTTARAENMMIQSVSSGSVNLSRTTTIGFAVNATPTVNESPTRVRSIEMNVSSTSSTNFSAARIKPFAMVVAATTSVTSSIRKSFSRAWNSINTTEMFWDQGKALRFKSQTTSSTTFSAGRGREAAFSAQEAVNLSWKANTSRGVALSSVTTSPTVGFDTNSVRGMVFTLPVTSGIGYDIDLKSRTNSIILAHPVVSITLNRVRTRGFPVLSVSGATMTIAHNKPLQYTVGEYVTIDGKLLRSTTNEVEEFGASSATDFVFGVGRGANVVIDASPDVGATIVRHISLNWEADTRSSFNVSSSPNRLDAFYVEYEAPVTSSLKDGSIIMGARKSFSSGVLHDVRPVFDVVIHPAPMYTITLYEEELQHG